MNRDPRPFELEINTLGYYVNRVFATLIRLLNKELKASNLNLQHSDFTILKVLNEVGHASQSEIATFLGKERSGISRSLTSLEKEGFIKREPVDGKTNSVSLSERGKEILPLINEIADRVTEKAFKGFSKNSSAAMIKNLNRIYHNTLREIEER